MFADQGSSFASSVRVEMARTSLAMTGLESRSFRHLVSHDCCSLAENLSGGCAAGPLLVHQRPAPLPHSGVRSAPETVIAVADTIALWMIIPLLCSALFVAGASS